METTNNLEKMCYVLANSNPPNQTPSEIIEKIKNEAPFKFEDGEMQYRMSLEEVKNILNSEFDIGDKHYGLRSLFWGEIQDYFNENDEIHMDCVSDALDNLLSNILEYLENNKLKTNK